MLRIIVGKIGGGKTLYAVREIAKELGLGRRTVVTNIALDLEKLQQYVESKYPDFKGDVRKRVRILDDAQTIHFFLHRGYRITRTTINVTPERSYSDAQTPNYYILPAPTVETCEVVQAPDKGSIVTGTIDFAPVTRAEEQNGKYPAINVIDYPEDSGVHYVLDEVQNYMNSRNWQAVGLSLTWYVSQHRKLNDEITAISQFPDQIDKQFRSFAQYWIQITNRGNTMTHGFRGRTGKFTAKYYEEQPPTNGIVRRITVALSDDYQFDLALAQCYDTTHGVGLKGRGKPETKKPLGWSPYWLIPVGVLLVGACWFVPKLLGGALNTALVQAPETVVKTAQEKSQSMVTYAQGEVPKPAQEQGWKEWGVYMFYKLDGKAYIGLRRGSYDNPETKTLVLDAGSVFYTVGREVQVLADNGAVKTYSPNSIPEEYKHESKQAVIVPRKTTLAPACLVDSKGSLGVQ